MTVSAGVILSGIEYRHTRLGTGCHLSWATHFFTRYFQTFAEDVFVQFIKSLFMYAGLTYRLDFLVATGVFLTIQVNCAFLKHFCCCAQ